MDRKIKRHLEARGVTFEKGRRKKGLFGTDRNAKAFFDWFYEGVMHFDSYEYRRQFWRAASREGHTIGDMPYTDIEFTDAIRHPRGEWFGNLCFLMAMMGISAVIWCLIKEIDRHVSRLRRPTYYERERQRRCRLAAERRRITKRQTINGCPTPEDLIKAFEEARLSRVHMIRFGSLLEDLECFVDNSPIWNTQTEQIAGRRGGIRQWLRDHVPTLSARYKTIMRYKALSKKFRQAVGVEDPVPAIALIPEACFSMYDKYTEGKTLETRASRENAPISRKERSNSFNKGNRQTKKGQGVQKKNETPRELSEVRMGTRSYLPEMTDWMTAKVREQSLAIARNILMASEDTVTSLTAQIALYIGEDLIAKPTRGNKKKDRTGIQTSFQMERIG